MTKWKTPPNKPWMNAAGLPITPRMTDIEVAKWHEMNPEASKKLDTSKTMHNASAAEVWGDWGRFEANDAERQDDGEEELRDELESAAADAVDDAEDILGGALCVGHDTHDAAAVRQLMHNMLGSDDASTNVQPPQPHASTDGMLQDAPASVHMPGETNTSDSTDAHGEGLCSNLVTMLTQMLQDEHPSIEEADVAAAVKMLATSTDVPDDAEMQAAQSERISQHARDSLGVCVKAMLDRGTNVNL